MSAKEIATTSRETNHEGPPPCERKRQDRNIIVAHALETTFKSMLERAQRIAAVGPPRERIVRCHDLTGMFGRVIAQQIVTHCRDDRARQHERRDHRENHRFRHRRKEKSCDPGQEKHRQERNADAQQRYERWADDLLSTIQDSLSNRLPLLQVPVDILDRHGRIVDQNTDR